MTFDPSVFKDILIVDDEALARQRLQSMLESLLPTASFRHAKDGLEALSRISEKSPDLMLLDVQMPGIDGVDVARQISSESFPIIFQTAYDKFAIDAFEVSACDYLLKPIAAERLSRALEKASDRILAVQHLKNLSQYCTGQGRPVRALSVSSSKESRMVHAADVACFVSKNHYTCLTIEGHEFTSTLSLDRLEELLDPQIFMRVHRNAIINFKFFKALSRGETDQILLTNGDLVEVSRRRLSAVKERLS